MHWFPIGLSVLAAAVSVGAMCFSVVGRNQFPGKGLSGYDLTTPEAAAKSFYEMGVVGDIRAQWDLELEKNKKKADEAAKSLNTFKVDRVLEYEAKSAVLFSIREKGIDKYEVRWIEKTPEGTLRQTYVETLGWKSKAGDEGKIGQMIAAWLDKNDSTQRTTP